MRRAVARTGALRLMMRAGPEPRWARAGGEAENLRRAPRCGGKGVERAGKHRGCTRVWGDGAALASAEGAGRRVERRGRMCATRNPIRRKSPNR